MSPIINTVVKDVGEIYGRLFDHRPFLQGEIAFFVKEFEEKRNDQEVQQLFEILENVTEIKETQLEKAHRLGDAQLCNVTTNLEVALRMCNKIVERGILTDVESKLEERRVQREQQLQQFSDEMAAKSLHVDKMFKDKEEEMRDYYAQLEETLHISPPKSPVSGK